MKELPVERPDDEQPGSDQCAKWLKAIGEPIRLRILRRLFQGPATVSAIAQSLDLEMATASHHLQVLLHADLVSVAKQGRFSVYSVNPEFSTQSESSPLFDFGCCRFEFSDEA